jgi:hypothetical protein
MNRVGRPRRKDTLFLVCPNCDDKRIIPKDYLYIKGKNLWTVKKKKKKEKQVSVKEKKSLVVDLN